MAFKNRTDADAPPPLVRAEDAPYYDDALFEIGIKIGQLPGDRTGPARTIVRNVIKDLAALGHVVQLLSNPECHNTDKRGGARPRVFMRSDMNRVGTFRTVLELEGRGTDDFLFDPRRHKGDNRPIDEVFRHLMADGLFTDVNSYDDLGSDLVTLILSAHRSAYATVRRSLDLVVVDEPVAVLQPDGGRLLQIVPTSNLDAAENVARSAAEHSNASALLEAFSNTFPAVGPEIFSEIYRDGRKAGRRVAQITATLTEAGASPNETGTVSTGYRPGSRRFLYTSADLSGAMKQIEAALDLVRPHWRVKAEPSAGPPRA